MKVFLKANFEIMLYIKYDFQLTKNHEGEELEEHRWAKKQ